MMKKKKEKPPVHSEKEKERKAVDKNETEDEKTFDFGGLPNRDLKKNLGCG